jgi:hypothetical protein
LVTAKIAESAKKRIFALFVFFAVDPLVVAGLKQGFFDRL